MKLRTLIDTGAQLSLLTLDAWEDICRNTRRSTRLRPLSGGIALKDINGKTVDTLGIAELCVLGKIVQYYVVRNIGKFDMLIGDDVARILNLKVAINQDTACDKIFLNGHKFRFYSNHEDDSSTFACLQTTLDMWINEFPDLFQTSGTLPVTPSFECHIDTGSNEPFHLKPYRMPLSKRRVVEQEVDRMLREDIIQPSSSPYASPICLVPKPDGSTRFCVDYRKLNSQTVRDSYPLPNIQDVIDSLTGSTVFSTLDLKSAYWQVPLSKDSIPKTSFICHRGQYEFKRMSFGLRNAPAIFQRFMNKIFAPYLGIFVYVYLDDIIVFSKSAADHDEHLRKVFDVLREHGLSLKPEKCHIGLSELKLLGYIINAQGYRSDPAKVAAISKMLAPKNVKEVRSLLGLCNYYRQMVPNYASITLPLTKLLHKEVPFIWGPEQEQAFRALKEELISDRILAYPQSDKGYKIFTDASLGAIGGVLVQDDENGLERPIAYFSKTLTGPQLNWSTIEKEGWALIYGLKKFEPYVYGNAVTAYTDHKPLKSLFINENRNTKVQRWSILLSELGCDIQYREGKRNIKADSLSRLRTEPQDPQPGDPDHPDAELLAVYILDVATGMASLPTKDDLPYAAWEPMDEADAILEELGNEVYAVSFDREIELEDMSRAEVDEILHEGDPGIPWEFDDLEKDEIRTEQKTMHEWKLGEQDMEDYVILEGLLYTLRPPPGKTAYPRLVLPPSCRYRVLRRAHAEVGHQGVRKTMERLQEAYKWPSQRRDVLKLITRCAVCQVNKGRMERVPPTHMPVAKYPCQILGMDLTGPLPPSADSGATYLLTIIDHHTGWAEAKPLPSKEAKHVLRYLVQEYIPRYGPPEILIVDNGCEFKNNTVVPYLEELGTEVRHTTPYKPSTAGKIERFHRTLKDILRKMVNAQGTRWEECLGPALYAHRVSHSVVTGYTPYMLQYGRHPITPKQKLLSRRLGDGPALLASRLDDLSLAFKEAARRTEESRLYNHRRHEAAANTERIVVGDHVCVKAHVRGKLDPKWDHGYIVVRIRKSVMFLVGPRNSRRIVNRAHVRKVDPAADWDSLNPRVKIGKRRRPRVGDRTVEEQPLARVVVRPDRDLEQDPDYDPPQRTARRNEPAGIVTHPVSQRVTRSMAKRGREDLDDSAPSSKRLARSVGADLVPPQSYTRMVTRSMRKRDTPDDMAGDEADIRVCKRPRPSHDDIIDMQIDLISFVYELYENTG